MADIRPVTEIMYDGALTLDLDSGQFAFKGAAVGGAATLSGGAAAASDLTAEIARAEAAEATFALASDLTAETSRAEAAEALALPAAGGAVTSDITFDATTHGPVLVDDTDGHTYRLTTHNGALVLVEVS